MSANPVDPTWSLEREIVLSRVFEAPRALVFRMWTEREHLARWFGPRGFTTTVHEHEPRVGGRWRFDMQAPDGTVFPNLVEYIEIAAPERLVFHHGSPDDLYQFRVTVTFDAQGDDKTVVTLRQLHRSKADRDAKIGFGAVELGYQTLDKLAEHLRAQT